MNLAEGESEGIACAKLLFFPVGCAGASGHTRTKKICLEVFSACAELPAGCPQKKKTTKKKANMRRLRNHVWFHLVRHKSGSKCVSRMGFHFFLKHNKCTNIYKDLFDR